MTLVANICEHIMFWTMYGNRQRYADEVRTNKRVIEAYLGRISTMLEIRNVDCTMA